jgi:hypothetical protein
VFYVWYLTTGHNNLSLFSMIIINYGGKSRDSTRLSLVRPQIWFLKQTCVLCSDNVNPSFSILHCFTVTPCRLILIQTRSQQKVSQTCVAFTAPKDCIAFGSHEERHLFDQLLFPYEGIIVLSRCSNNKKKKRKRQEEDTREFSIVQATSESS